MDDYKISEGNLAVLKNIPGMMAIEEYRQKLRGLVFDYLTSLDLSSRTKQPKTLEEAEARTNKHLKEIGIDIDDSPSKQNQEGGRMRCDICSRKLNYFQVCGRWFKPLDCYCERCFNKKFKQSSQSREGVKNE